MAPIVNGDGPALKPWPGSGTCLNHLNTQRGMKGAWPYPFYPAPKLEAFYFAFLSWQKVVHGYIN